MQPDQNQNIPPTPPFVPPVAPVQPQPIVGIVPPPAFTSPQPAGQAPVDQGDRGRTLSIVALFINIVNPIVALVLSIIGYTKSKKAGYGGKLGRIGILVSSILLVLELTFSAILFVTVALPLIQKGDAESSAFKTDVATSEKAQPVYKNAATVNDIAGIFAVNYGQFPSSVADFSKSPNDASTSNVSSLPAGVTVSGTNPTADNGQSVIGYQYTIDPSTKEVNGGRVTYWDYNKNVLVADEYYVGDATSSSTFIPIK